MRRFLFKREPDQDEIEVRHETQRFTVKVRRRSTARRFTLRVSGANGDITLTLPERAEITAARVFAERHGAWIAARLSKRQARIVFEAGTSVPLRGTPHRIVHWSRVRGVTQATLTPDGEAIIAVSGEPAHLARRIGDFLRREAMRDLEAAVARHTASLELAARKITVRDTTSRWGSCSSRGHLNFSWRLILAPPMVLDYLAAHEVAHLKEMNHSHRFWALTHRLCPRTPEAERWLKSHGPELHRYG
jgi:hypothetical protein